MEDQSNFSFDEQKKSTSNNTVIPVHDHLSNVDSFFSPNTNTTLSLLSLQELIDFHKKKIRKQITYALSIFGIISFIGLILIIVSLVLPQCDDYVGQCSKNLVLLVVGSTLGGFGILLLLVTACVFFYQLRNQFNDLNDNRITQQQPTIWRLDGEEWIRYLNYIHGPDREWTQLAPLSSFCCRQSSYNRLIDRQFGQIVLYWNGLVIDELYFISFRQYELQSIEIMNFNLHQQIQGLRIHTYLKAGKNSRDCYFDVFAPCSISLEQLQMIAYSYRGIMTDSTGARLTALGLQLLS